MTLFATGDHRLHSGGRSTWLIDCDALTYDDLTTIATQIVLPVLTRLDAHYSAVVSIPRGGYRFASVLTAAGAPVTGDPAHPRLLVDDVWTTGASLRAVHAPGDRAIVLYARGRVASWCWPIWELGSRWVGGRP